MPVGTYGTVKGVMPSSLHDMNAQIILGNTFHLWLRPGMDVISLVGYTPSRPGTSPYSRTRVAFKFGA